MDTDLTSPSTFWRAHTKNKTTYSLNTKENGKNVQGDELVARLWAKNLLEDERVVCADINGKDKYDVTISFNPLIHEPNSGFKVLYMQNIFPKPNWTGTVEMFQESSSRYDGFVFPSQGLKDLCGEDGLVCQFATDLDIFSPREYNQALDFNLCFVGNKIRDETTTERYMMCAKEKGLVIFGNRFGWQNEYCRGKISIEDESVLYSSSKICLNSHVGEHLQNGTFNFRIFNVLACGGFIISDHSKHLEDEFGDCMVFTSGYQDLAEKVDYYLNNPDETLKYREAGLKKVREKHTFKHRMDDLFNWLEGKI